MKKYAAVFTLFILFFAGAAICRAQTPLATWTDVNNFLSGTDTDAVITGNISAAYPGYAVMWGGTQKTIDGGNFTLTGTTSSLSAFYPQQFIGHDISNNVNLTVSNMTITGFDRGVFMLNAQFYTAEPVVYSGTLDIGPNMIFQGNNRTNDAGSVLWNEYLTTVADGTIFRNNTSPYGGAVYNKDTIYFGNNVIFDNNSALNSAFNYMGGGAIITSPGERDQSHWNTYIGTGAQFTNNKAANILGGAIFNQSTYVEVGQNSYFAGNTAAYGGAMAEMYLNLIYTAARPVTVIGAGAVFENNTATSSGGAIFSWDGKTELQTAAGKTTVFQGNRDSSGLNDIYLYYGNASPELDITGAGGAVEFYGGIRSNAAGGLIPLINKTSTGEMILRAGSVNNNYVGTFTQTAGVTSVYSTNFFRGANNINNSVLHFYTTNAANVLNVNGGTVDLRGAAAGSYNTLTTNTWNASGAKLNINTYLDGDGTSTDKLVVNGSATGNTTLYVTQAGTNNVPTPNGSDGILVVDVTNATTKTAVFALNGGVVDTGALEYTLNHAADENWYLKSGALTPTANTIANMPALHLTLVKTAMSELRRRTGDLFINDAGCRPNNIWARVYGRRLNVDEKIEADMTLFGAQAGVDTRVFSGGANRAYAGVMGGYSSTNDIKVKQPNGFNGTGKGTTPSAGVYGVWFNENGWFADLTAQYFWTQMKMKNISAAKQIISYDTDRDFWSAGLEGGKSVSVSRTVVLTPKAQVLFANGAPASHTTNMANNVYYASTQSLTAALRLQATYLKHGANSRWQPFAELGAYNEFMGKTDINFAGVDMKSNVGGAGFEAALGTNVRLSGSSYLFGDVSFEKGSVYQALAANLGVRLSFGGLRCGECRDGRENKNCAAAQKEKPAPVIVEPPAFTPEAPAAAIPGIQIIRFDFDKHNLSYTVDDGKVREAAAVVKNSGLNFEVRGHTDAKGSGWYNLNLSKQRAREIYMKLLSLGVPAARLSYKGFGEDRPVATNETDEGRALNRRVEIVPMP